jgi:AcrR family transcriptional regulator
MPQTRIKDKQGKSAKWQQRRHEIVDASAKVFAARGYHATSTNELCDANGIGKGALYYYIGSKEQLLAAIHDRVMDEVMLGADRADLAGGTPPERLAMLGEELLDVIFRFPDHVWVFLHDFPAARTPRCSGSAAAPTSAGWRPSSRRAPSRATSARLTPG